MVTTERDLLMKLPLPNLTPTPMPRLTPGMVTTERDLLMRLPLLNLAPTLMPRLIRGTVTTVHTVTGLTVMVTTALATEAITGDKKWTSRTTSDLSLPADSSVKRQFLQNNFLF